MLVNAILRSVGLGRSQDGRQLAFPLPLYSPVASSDAGAERADQSDMCLSAEELEKCQSQKAQRPGSSGTPRFAMPSLTRFLADFTLGFADGLTVPFALTAGLSSLGQTETVIY